VAGENKITYAMSRRQKTAIFILCAALIAAAICLDHSGRYRRLPALSRSEQEATTYDLEKYHRKTFTVARVVDGDTLDLDVPDGKYPTTRVRLWGIDTPETQDLETGPMYFGHEAAEFAGTIALGKSVTVYLDQQNRTRGYYGRLLAYLQLPDGRFLNEILLREGYAYADLRFRHSFYHKYQQLQAIARGQKKGLWKKITQSQLPCWLQRLRPNLLPVK